jgi:hypothetical protein
MFEKIESYFFKNETLAPYVLFQNLYQNVCGTNVFDKHIFLQKYV